MLGKSAKLLLGLILLMSLTSCALRLTMAPVEQDIAAKNFSPPSDKGRIYVYRPSKFFAGAAAYIMYMDGKPWGALNVNNYLMLDMTPGEYIVSVGLVTVTKINVEPGKLYFLEMTPFFSGPELRQVKEHDGKKGIEKSQLVAGVLK